MSGVASAAKKAAGQVKKLKGVPIKTPRPVYGETIRPVIPEAAGVTHKWVTSKHALYRDTLQKGISLPNKTFVLIKPGKPMPPNTAVFRVPLDMNRLQIKDYLEELYRIPVVRVNTMIYLGKHRFTSKGYFYRRPDWKKAVVTLTEEFKFPEFKNTPEKRPAAPQKTQDSNA